MKDLLQKISSYNIFNYLLPGVVFVTLLRLLTKYELIIDDFIVGVFFYYFIGLIINRIGSLVIEPIIKKTSLVKFFDYRKFISASRKDEKIDLFSEVNNMYRTFISMFLILLLIIIYEKFSLLLSISHFVMTLIGLILLIILFIFSYKKQSEYINKRIDSQI
jgi:hypothetical protein